MEYWVCFDYSLFISKWNLLVERVFKVNTRFFIPVVNGEASKCFYTYWLISNIWKAIKWCYTDWSVVTHTPILNSVSFVRPRSLNTHVSFGHPFCGRQEWLVLAQLPSIVDKMAYGLCMTQINHEISFFLTTWYDMKHNS